ncbi:hypothetical protein Cni_G29456 [Canna indica]|uniref:Uncharacterized protein n=1 Tax=Canna indica TaxID=4628 RepID=A0AAQ3L992_9LILI|nr:hypothetical protein Cni_G29456 [Canna indica]
MHDNPIALIDVGKNSFVVNENNNKVNNLQTEPKAVYRPWIQVGRKGKPQFKRNPSSSGQSGRSFIDNAHNVVSPVKKKDNTMMDLAFVEIEPLNLLSWRRDFWMILLLICIGVKVLAHMRIRFLLFLIRTM